MLLFAVHRVETLLENRGLNRESLRLRLIPSLAVFGAALLVYLVTALLGRHTASPPSAYFDQLADAYLHGRLYLAHPPSVHDLTLFGGRWYVPFPPLPALLMLPWVAAFGLRNTSTVMFSILCGAATVALIYLCLATLAERGWTRLRTRDNLWLTALFAFGTVHWYMTIDGNVWFFGQVSAVTFVALACLLTLRRASPWWIGAVLALAMLGRPTIVLSYPLLLAITLQEHRPEGQPVNRRALAAWAAGTAMPVLIVVAGMLLYNAARFGNALNFGYQTENVIDFLRAPLAQYGQFNLHFVPHNLQVMLIGLPYWRPQCRLLVPSIDGMSLFLTTPALLYVFRARPRRWLAAGAWLSCALLLVPLLTYYNTGSWQFGYRFSLDFSVPALVLLALGSGRRVGWPERGLILASIAINAIGVAWWMGAWCGFPT